MIDKKRMGLINIKAEVANFRFYLCFNQRAYIILSMEKDRL